MGFADILGIVLGTVSVVLLAIVLYLLQRVYVVMRRDQMPGGGSGSGQAPGQGESAD